MDTVRPSLTSGVFYSSTGYEYAGNFEHDAFEGFGTLKSPDSVTYTGNWKDGLMNGRGTLKQENGETFVGEFLNGKKHGKGIYSFKNSQGKTERVEGIWELGNLKHSL
jgi:hypothetical protein